MGEPITYRQATRDDLCALGDLFTAAFPESVQFYVGRRTVSPAVMADVFTICLDAENEAFFVAQQGERLVGYIFAPSNFSHVITTAIVHGHLLSMFVRWITGRYGIGFYPVTVAIRNWWLLLRESSGTTQQSNARILSVAVDPKAQGHGIGTGLLRLALDYLDSRHVPVVRLEVRPDNRAAIHLYQKYRFSPAGKMHDTQGDWLIMFRKTAGP